ncbi:MAG TPA: hypothetical protein VEJ00_06565 [Candidatus Acidoferrales bacterium]|nr:hypothetical protein [Candidatus Acidoferrales bacterium]
MLQEMVGSQFLVALAHSYEEDPRRFVSLPKPMLDSSVARMAVAELRNEGYVEEQVRGVIRLTPRGYKAYKEHIN